MSERPSVVGSTWIGTLPIEALLARRDALIAALEEVDGELVRRGVVATKRTPVNGRPATTAILALLTAGPRDVRDLRRELGAGPGSNAVDQLLSTLVARHEVVRLSRGRYALPSPSEQGAPGGAS